MQTIFLIIAVFCCGLQFRMISSASTLALNKKRIVNGQTAKIEDFPFQLSVRRNTFHICGAAILQEFWAMTAAHCFDGFVQKPSEISLRYGSELRMLGGELVAVANIYKHPTYNSTSMNYDIALLRTITGFRTDIGKPIRLPEVDEPLRVGAEATVSGWGYQSSTDHVLSSNLKYTKVNIVNQTKCHKDMRDHDGITDAMFCAAARATDSCQGDSGGPIQINGLLIGIVSWGVGCADPHYPGVYTRVAYPPIRRWVKVITKL